MQVSVGVQLEKLINPFKSHSCPDTIRKLFSKTALVLDPLLKSLLEKLRALILTLFNLLPERYDSRVYGSACDPLSDTRKAPHNALLDYNIRGTQEHFTN